MRWICCCPACESIARACGTEGGPARRRTGGGRAQGGVRGGQGQRVSGGSTLRQGPGLVLRLVLTWQQGNGLVWIMCVCVAKSHTRTCTVDASTTA